MSKFKVGDRVRIVGDVSWHQFMIGEFVTVDDAYLDTGFYAKDKNGVLWYVSNVDAILAPSNKITAGKTYKTVGQGDWYCIHTKGETAWMVRDYGDGDIEGSTAYPFKTDGEAISFGDGEYRVILEPEVTEHEGWFSIGNGDDVGEVRCKYNRVNGKVDWDSLQVVK